MEQAKKRSPWSWIPSLYFAQGLPYVAVMTISVILYKRMGISNTDIALYTSWLYLPWVIKPFWSPFVDLIKTKRWWIVTMQLIVGLGLAGIAFTIPMSSYFQITLAIFWLIGFSSATHDIAADGFYMLALDSHSQSLYVGIRSTFYRMATIFAQGILVILAGVLEISTGKEPVNIVVATSPDYAHEIVIPDIAHGSQMLAKNVDFKVFPDTLKINTENITKERSSELLALVSKHNIDNGFVVAEEKIVKESKEGWWSKSVSKPFGIWIKKTFGEKKDKVENNTNGALSLASVVLTKAPKSGETVVLNIAHKGGDESIKLVSGERLEFTQENWDTPALVAFQIDAKLKSEAEARFQGLSGNIPLAWAITFIALAVFFLLLNIYHYFILPRPAVDKPAADVTAGTLFKEFLRTFKSFFKKDQVWVAITFMLLYRLPEAQLVKLINPFLLDGTNVGGMGLTTGQVGIVYGTVGIIGLTLGGIIGGIAAARGGLKKWLWPMAASLTLTCATYLYLSITQTDNLFIINLCVFIDQFGYGFGFTAYMLYMIYFSAGEYKTAHYAICTAFMALSMMIPGMFAGWLQEQLGYTNFFWWIMICCLATVVVTSFLKIDPKFGKKEIES